MNGPLWKIQSGLFFIISQIVPMPYNYSMEYKYTGIILSKKDIGEADRLYTIYTLEAGKIQALAKGVRKPQARLAGSLENFNLADVTVVRKQGTGKIISSIVEENFSAIRNSLEASVFVLGELKTMDKLTGLEMRDKELFLLLKEHLETVNRMSGKHLTGKKQGFLEKVRLLSLGFRFKLFSQLGYKIGVVACPDCGKKVKMGKNYFSPSAGGIVCRSCIRAGEETRQIADNAIKLIRIFYQNKIASLSKVKTARKDLDDLEGISVKFLNWIDK